MALLGTISSCCIFFHAVLNLQILASATPRLVFQPISDNGSTLIYYKMSDPQNARYWLEKRDHFLRPYRNYTDSNSVIECTRGEPPKPGSDLVCSFRVDRFLTPCLASNADSLNSRGGPCIFLQVQEVTDWTPEYYNGSSELPKSMPRHLKNTINYDALYSPHDLKTVWLSCGGEYPADVENIGPILYFPNFGFDGQYFPARNKDEYISPLVSVLFERPSMGTVIGIKCKIWAKNIDLDEEGASVRFDLLVDY